MGHSGRNRVPDLFRSRNYIHVEFSNDAVQDGTASAAAAAADETAKGRADKQRISRPNGMGAHVTKRSPIRQSFTKRYIGNYRVLLSIVVNHHRPIGAAPAITDWKLI